MAKRKVNDQPEGIAPPLGEIKEVADPDAPKESAPESHSIMSQVAELRDKVASQQAVNEELKRRLDNQFGVPSPPEEVARAQYATIQSLERMERQGHRKKFFITKPYKRNKRVDGVMKTVEHSDMRRVVWGESAEEVTERLRKRVHTRDKEFPYKVVPADKGEAAA